MIALEIQMSQNLPFVRIEKEEGNGELVFGMVDQPPLGSCVGSVRLHEFLSL